MTVATRRQHARFWYEVLAAGPTRIAAVAGDEQVTRTLPLPEGVAAAAAGRPHGPHLVVGGAVIALLHRYTGAESVTIGQGAPLGGGVDGTGPCPLIPLRCTVSGTDTFADVVDRLRDAVFDSYAHQNFDVTLVRDTPFQVAVRADGLHMAPGPVPLLLEAAPGTLTARATGIATDLVVRVLRHLAALLDQVLADPGRPLADVDLRTGEDRTFLARCNDTAYDHGPHRTLKDLVADATAAHRDARAVLSGDTVLTYRELDRGSDALAADLVARGARRVAVVAERSPALVVAVLAVVKAGAVLVPADPSLPAELIDLVLRDSGVDVVLRGDITAPERTLPPVTVLPGDPAYVSHTSGSTGRPKGVVVEHAAVVNLLAGTQRAYPLGPGDVVLHKTSLSFDVAVWELFGWLAGGAALALLPPGAERDPDAIIDAVERHDVTVMDLAPHLLGAVADQVVARGAGERMRSLRLVSTGGDELTPDHVRRFRRAFPGTRLVNFYGPTEATVQVTHHPVGEPGERVPIGGPLDNTRLHVVDPRLRPQPVGVPGELCIAGECLARGYLGRPELTADRFVPAPALGEARVYRTGDLVRRLDDGALEFLGRLDQQVKVRGHRIEPGEVEHRLRDCPGVTDAVVVAAGASAEDRRLVAYVTGAPDTAGVLLRLRAVLPEYLVPSEIHTVPAFPVTASGKIDRRRLGGTG